MEHFQSDIGPGVTKEEGSRRSRGPTSVGACPQEPISDQAAERPASPAI